MNIYKRQASYVHSSKMLEDILVVGAGNIGSWTTLGLTKIGFQGVSVLDHDSVEAHNTASQLYGMRHGGMSKVSALSDLVKNLTSTTVVPYEETWNGHGANIVISAVDSMMARKQIYEGIKKKSSWFIDGRMGGNLIYVYAIPTNDSKAMSFYEGKLVDDDQTMDIPCSMQSISYNSMLVSGLICDLVVQITNEEAVPRELVFDIKNFYLYGC